MRRRRIRPGTLLFPQNTTESAPSVTRSGAAPPLLAAPPSAGTARDFWRAPLNIGTASFSGAQSRMIPQNHPKWEESRLVTKIFPNGMMFFAST